MLFICASSCACREHVRYVRCERVLGFVASHGRCLLQQSAQHGGLQYHTAVSEKFGSILAKSKASPACQIHVLLLSLQSTAPPKYLAPNTWKSFWIGLWRWSVLCSTSTELKLVCLVVQWSGKWASKPSPYGSEWAIMGRGVDSFLWAPFPTDTFPAVILV